MDVPLPAKTLTLVPSSSWPPVPDGHHVVSPIRSVLLGRNVARSHTVVEITDSVISLPSVNFGLPAQVLPKGMSLTTICPLDKDQVSLLAPDSPPSPSDETPTDSWQDDAGAKIIVSELSAAEAEGLYRLSESNKDVFGLDNPLVQASAVEHSVNTAHANPVRSRPYRVSHAECLVLLQKVYKMLDNDVIVPSYHPRPSPVVLVKRKDGTWSLCVDYLNTITKKTYTLYHKPTLLSIVCMGPDICHQLSYD